MKMHQQQVSLQAFFLALYNIHSLPTILVHLVTCFALNVMLLFCEMIVYVPKDVEFS